MEKFGEQGFETTFDTKNKYHSHCYKYIEQSKKTFPELRYNIDKNKNLEKLSQKKREKNENG